jgi:predicted RecB family nuclease
MSQRSLRRLSGFEGVLIRADVFERLPEGRWRLYEVKSSTSFHEKYLEEITLQAYIILSNKLKLAELYLVHLNQQYVRNLAIDWSELFNKEDVTEDCRPLFDNIWPLIDEMHDVLALPEAPAVRPGHRCSEPYPCEFWERCTAHKTTNWVFNIPRLTKQVFERFERYGYESMQDIPASFVKQLSPTQQRVVNAAKSGKVWRSPLLAEALAQLTPPVSYLDFETFNPAIPLYPNTSPYERIPFQWSLHHDDGRNILTHAEFLANGKIDPRREFAESLLGAVEWLPGPVAVWSSFEAGVIRELSGLFPDMTDRLAAVLARIVDLLQVTREHAYHPAFRGSYSMKAVAAAVAPEIVYDRDIIDGSEASAAFYRIVIDPTLTPETSAELRRALLKYCSNDSAALAGVHRWLKAHG